MTYRIKRTEKAAEQIRNLIVYIAETFDVDSALGYLDKLESGIALLADNPEPGFVPRQSVIKKQGYRVLAVERHLIFYKMHSEESLIMIYAVFDAKQDYINLIGK